MTGNAELLPFSKECGKLHKVQLQCTEFYIRFLFFVVVSNLLYMAACDQSKLQE